MHRLKDIKSEILEQHRQLAFNRRELNLRRWELRQKFQQSLHSRGLMMGSFAFGLLLGWAWTRPAGGSRGDAPLFKGLKALSRWVTPVKGLLLNGLIKTATNYTADRISEELHEHHDQRR